MRLKYFGVGSVEGADAVALCSGAPCVTRLCVSAADCTGLFTLSVRPPSLRQIKAGRGR